MIYLVYTIMLIIFGLCSLLFAPNYNIILFILFLLGAYCFLKEFIKFINTLDEDIEEKNKKQERKEYILPEVNLIEHEKNETDQLTNLVFNKVTDSLSNTGASFEISSVFVYSKLIRVLVEFKNEEDIKIIKNNKSIIEEKLEYGPIEIKELYNLKNTIEIIISNKDSYPLYLYDYLKKGINSLNMDLYLGNKDDDTKYIFDLRKYNSLFITGINDLELSNMLNLILINLLMTHLPTEVDYYLIDGKKIEFSNYKKIPFLKNNIFDNVEDGINKLQDIILEMGKREDYLLKHRNRNFYELSQSVFKEIVILINDFDSIYCQNEEYSELLKIIIRKGNKVGVHLIVTTNYVNYKNSYNNVLSLSDVILAFQHNYKTNLNKYIPNIINGAGYIYFSDTHKTFRLSPSCVGENDIKKVIEYYK